MYIYRGKIGSDQITVIVPTTVTLGESVYVASPWAATADSGCNNFRVGMISSMELTEDGQKFGFQQDDYTLNATVLDGKTSLEVSMKKDANTLADATLRLVYSYQASNTSALRVYIGKMNYSSYASNKMLVVVAPDGLAAHNPLCLYWQWTMTSDGVNDRNVEYTYTITSAQGTEKGEQITFKRGFYSFVADVNEYDDTMTATMTDGNGWSTSPLVLSLADLEPSVIGRPKRSLGGDKTSVVVNDTTGEEAEVVVCTLRNSATATTDKVLAVIGLSLALAAVVTIVPAAAGALAGITVATGVKVAATAAGYAVTVLSVPPAVAGAVHTFSDSGQARSALLFPGDILTRRSTGGLTSSNNDLEIIRAYIRHDGENYFLTVAMATVDGIGHGTKEVSSLIKTLQFATLFDFGLEGPTAIHSLRLMRFNSLNSTLLPRRSDAFGESDIAGGIFAKTENPNPPTTQYLSRYEFRGPLNSDNMNHIYYDSLSFLVLGQGTISGVDSSYQILHLSRSTIVLKLVNHCFNIPYWNTYRCLGRGQEDDESVLSLIASNRSPQYWAYQWINGWVSAPPSESNTPSKGRQEVCLRAMTVPPLLSLSVTKQKDWHIYIVASDWPDVSRKIVRMKPHFAVST